MAEKKLMVDSTILIEYFRKTDKGNSRLFHHFQQYSRLYISAVTEFEVVTGATSAQVDFWNQMLVRFDILNFDSTVARCAAKIEQELKPKRKSIDKPDLFIAATALVHKLELDTLNVKHFVHIDGLELCNYVRPTR